MRRAESAEWALPSAELIAYQFCKPSPCPLEVRIDRMAWTDSRTSQHLKTHANVHRWKTHLGDNDSLQTIQRNFVKANVRWTTRLAVLRNNSCPQGFTFGNTRWDERLNTRKQRLGSRSCDQSACRLLALTTLGTSTSSWVKRIKGTRSRFTGSSDLVNLLFCFVRVYM